MQQIAAEKTHRAFYLVSLKNRQRVARVKVVAERTIDETSFIATQRYGVVRLSSRDARVHVVSRARNGWDCSELRALFYPMHRAAGHAV